MNSSTRCIFIFHDIMLDCGPAGRHNESLTNYVGFSTYVFSKPRVSLARNRAHCEAWATNIFFRFLARIAIKNKTLQYRVLLEVPPQICT